MTAPLALTAPLAVTAPLALTAPCLYRRRVPVGITGFAVQEAIWGSPVVEQTPFFFGH